MRPVAAADRDEDAEVEEDAERRGAEATEVAR
jgi:hypothetical protein